MICFARFSSVDLILISVGRHYDIADFSIYESIERICHQGGASQGKGEGKD
jgi:hypothetical protein